MQFATTDIGAVMHNMKRFTSKLALVLLSIAAGLCQAQSWYGGVSGGRSTWSHNSTDLSGATGTTTRELADDAYKAYGGYRINRNFSAEFGYALLGISTAKFSSGQVELKNSAWFASIKGDIPLDKDYTLFGKLGLARKTSASTISDSSLCSNCYNSYNNPRPQLTYGIGLSYKLNAQTDLRIEYEDFGSFGTKFNYSSGIIATGTGRSETQLWSGGVTLSF